MNDRYLFYLCRGVSSVFDSQVISLINAICEKKTFNKVYLIIGINNQKEKEELKKRETASGIQVIAYKSYPNYPFFNFLQRKSISKAVKITGINLYQVIFHIRGEITAWHLSKVLRRKYHQNIIPDIRGASTEEVEEFFEINKMKKVFKKFNYDRALKNLNKFRNISVVSISLRDYLVERYNIDENKIHITPNLAGHNFRLDTSRRDEIRAQLNINREDFLIVFSSGSTAKWQNNNIVLILAEKGMKILNLSKKEIHHKSIINKFVNYVDVPLYLNAADAAVIWRDNSMVNKVASPVKFSEYICCGLPVIANKSVDLIRNFLIKYSCGLLIDDFNELNAIALKKLIQLNRKEISSYGKETFGMDKIIYSYINLYSIN